VARASVFSTGTSLPRSADRRLLVLTRASAGASAGGVPDAGVETVQFTNAWFENGIIPQMAAEQTVSRFNSVNTVLGDQLELAFKSGQSANDPARHIAEGLVDVLK
jgi:hypothetical protein